MAFKTEITTKDVADMAVGGLTNNAASIVSGIPYIGPVIGLLNLDEKLKASPVVKKLEKEARETIVTAGNDKASVFGQLFQWFSQQFSSAMSWLNSLLGIPPEPSSSSTTVSANAGGEQNPQEKAAAAEKARLAAEKAKLPSSIAGGNPAANAPSQNLPNGKPPAAASTERAPAA